MTSRFVIYSCLKTVLSIWEIFPRYIMGIIMNIMTNMYPITVFYIFVYKVKSNEPKYN